MAFAVPYQTRTGHHAATAGGLIALGRGQMAARSLADLGPTGQAAARAASDSGPSLTRRAGPGWPAEAGSAAAPSVGSLPAVPAGARRRCIRQCLGAACAGRTSAAVPMSDSILMRNPLSFSRARAVRRSQRAPSSNHRPDEHAGQFTSAGEITARRPSLAGASSAIASRSASASWRRARSSPLRRARPASHFEVRRRACARARPPEQVPLAVLVSHDHASTIPSQERHRAQVAYRARCPRRDCPGDRPRP